MPDKEALKNQIKKQVGTLHHYHKTFNSVHGQKVLFDLFKECNLLKSSYEYGNSEETTFQEGRRSVLLHILKKLKTDPNLLLEQIENFQRSEKEDN